MCKKTYIWNPSTCNCENGKYLDIDDSVITCDEIIQVTKNYSNQKLFQQKLFQQKLFQEILTKISQSIKQKISILYSPFH